MPLKVELELSDDVLAGLCGLRDLLAPVLGTSAASLPPTHNPPSEDEEGVD